MCWEHYCWEHFCKEKRNKDKSPHIELLKRVDLITLVKCAVQERAMRAIVVLWWMNISQKSFRCTSKNWLKKVSTISSCHHMITGWVVCNTYKKYKWHESSAKCWCVEVVDFYISAKSEREKRGRFTQAPPSCATLAIPPDQELIMQHFPFVLKGENKNILCCFCFNHIMLTMLSKHPVNLQQ